MNIREKIKIKKAETFENHENAELSDEELEAVAGGAGQTDTLKCSCDECGAVLEGEDAVTNHYNTTNHCSYHYTS